MISFTVLDGSKDEPTAGIYLGVNPNDSGHINCDGKDYATHKHLRIKFGASCKPQANEMMKQIISLVLEPLKLLVVFTKL
jgi:hypothetical protein